MTYKNLMEEVIIGELNGVIKDFKGGVCDCELCREDMIAWALNRLPAKYVVTKVGYVYSKFETLRGQLRTDIITRLAEAVKVVKAKPRHK